MIESMADLRYYLCADLVAQGYGSKWHMVYRFTRRVAYYQRLLRICEYLRNSSPTLRPAYFVYRLRLQLLSERLGFDIPLNVFGPGLSIAHPGSIVVNAEARVGSGCRIHHGVTIGAVGGGSPVLEDNVFISPDVGIYGAIRVGKGSVLGPNTLVKASIPRGSVVSANPSDPLKRPQGEWENSHLSDFQQHAGSMRGDR
ncbi:serine acetyltransferase [Actinomycetospora corticicola]|uniref:serine acetyltransferase n=2 Tax=Actinomycetospora corticicola TaxID=663602 RepID=UPI003CD06A05